MAGQPLLLETISDERRHHARSQGSTSCSLGATSFDVRECSQQEWCEDINSRPWPISAEYCDRMCLHSPAPTLHGLGAFQYKLHLTRKSTTSPRTASPQSAKYHLSLQSTTLINKALSSCTSIYDPINSNMFASGLVILPKPALLGCDWEHASSTDIAAACAEALKEDQFRNGYQAQY